MLENFKLPFMRKRHKLPEGVVIPCFDYEGEKAKQLAHDQANHPEIFNLEPDRRISHYIKHYVKYLPRLTPNQNTPIPLEKTIVDSTLITLSFANATGKQFHAMPAMGYLSHSQKIDAYQHALGLLSKAFDDPDHARSKDPAINYMDAAINNGDNPIGFALQMIMGINEAIAAELGLDLPAELAAKRKAIAQLHTDYLPL